MTLQPILITILVFALIWIVLYRNKATKQQIKSNSSPINIDMATHYEHAKFRVRYRDLEPSQELYKIGLRNGQYGVILKHKSGMFAKTTVDGQCHFIKIESYNYTPMGS